MKRYIYYVLISLLLPLSVVAQTDGYDPVNPPDPNWPDDNTTIYYKVVLEAIPYGSGRFSLNNYSSFKAGETVTVTAQDHNDCYFICWKDVEGNEVTTDRTLQFTMPASDVKYYAIYSYDPAGPGNPELVNRYMLSLKCEPAVAGYSYFKDQKVFEGSQQSLYVYRNSGFKFLYWKDADGIILGTDQSLSYLMPSHASTVTAYFEYAPDDPMQPGTNVWDKEGGELIVDYFQPGRLLSAMDNMVGSSNRDMVTHFVVDGEINNNDWGFPYYYKNLTYIDFSRAYGSDAVASRWLENNTNIQEVELPSCIVRIGSYAFRGCTSLRAIDCYATIPPVVDSYAFDGLPSELVVFVPEESIGLYEADAAWNRFTISPLKSKVCTLELRLPEECSDGRYKNASLELLNVKSGQRLKYVISDRLNYTFTNLIRNTKHKVFVKNLTGDIIYESDVITIDDENKQFTLTGLKLPYDVTMRVCYANGTDVTDKVNITWATADNVFLCQGAKVAGQLEEAVLKYSISVPSDIAAEYYAPQPGKHTVVAGENTVTVTLQPIPTVKSFGVVLDDLTGKPLSGAYVVYEQRIEGSGSVTVNAETDAAGRFSLTSRMVPTTVRISASSYVPFTREYAVEDIQDKTGESGADFGNFRISRVTGVTAHVGFVYTSAVPEGEVPSSNNYFPYQENVSYTLYNISTQSALQNFIVEGNRIYILSGASAGDQIRATCTSTNEKFAPVTIVADVNANKGLELQFPITELGKVFARFLVTDNTSVEGLLYDAAGHLVRHETYNTNFTPTESDELGDLLDHNKTPNFIYLTDLPAGEYSLITMGKSNFFGTLSTLGGYAEAGLKAGTDYVVNKITVQDGTIQELRNVVIPVFEESKFYYTGQNTKFSVNKASIVEGNYLTLSAKVDF